MADIMGLEVTGYEIEDSPPRKATAAGKSSATATGAETKTSTTSKTTSDTTD